MNTEEEFVESLALEHDLKYKQLVESVASAERAVGTECKIDYTLPSIEISREGMLVYHFQEWAASELLETVPPDLKPEDFLLFSQSSW